MCPLFLNKRLIGCQFWNAGVRQIPYGALTLGIHDAYRGADQMGFEPMEIPLTVALPAHERRGVRTEEPSMTRRCELTGKLPMSGQLRSHAENGVAACGARCERRRKPQL